MCSLIAQLDVLVSFAEVSSANNYVRPAICKDEKEQIYLIESKHPLLDIQDNHSCISNDCHMLRGKSNL